MTKASDYKTLFTSFGEKTIGTHTVMTGTTKAGATWFYHAPCKHWFPKFQSTHGGIAANEQTWLQHVCPNITLDAVTHPDWTVLANKVRAQSKRLAAG